MVRVRRHRRIGDRVEHGGKTFEIVGIHGNGHYGIKWVGDHDKPCGPYLSTELGLWVEDTAEKRPYPFEEV